MIGVGSRVRYERGPSADRWCGLIGIVESLTARGNLNVAWENPTNISGKYGSVIDPKNVTEIMMIDPKRAIETIESEPRQCRTIGILERREGTVTVLLAVPYRGKEDTGEVEINLDGKPVSGTYIGGSLSFRNVPKVSSGFYPLERTGYPVGARGVISLSLAKSEYPSHPFFVEIITVDGVPTEAKIHAR